MTRTRNRNGWLTRHAAQRVGRARRAGGEIRAARPSDLPALAQLIAERDLTPSELADAVDQGRILVVDEGETVIAAAVVGSGPAPRLRLLVVAPHIIAAGIVERLRSAAAALAERIG